MKLVYADWPNGYSAYASAHARVRDADMPKYSLTDETIEHEGHLLHRVQYEDGTIGGWIEAEDNLSQDGDARVYGDARVFGNARVFGDAQVFGDVQVFGDARVYGDARVFGNARVFGDARVFGNAWVVGNARVYGNAEVFGNAQVSAEASVNPIVISGGDYKLTITDNDMIIGCQFHSFEWWRNEADEVLSNHDHALWQQHKGWILELIKATRG